MNTSSRRKIFYGFVLLFALQAQAQIPNYPPHPSQATFEKETVIATAAERYVRRFKSENETYQDEWDIRLIQRNNLNYLQLYIDKRLLINVADKKQPFLKKELINAQLLDEIEIPKKYKFVYVDDYGDRGKFLSGATRYVALREKAMTCVASGYSKKVDRIYRIDFERGVLVHHPEIGKLEFSHICLDCKRSCID